MENINRLPRRHRAAVKIALAALVLAVWIRVNNASYDDEVRQEATYCDMVKRGAWGDYNPWINCAPEYHL